mmetsp:Transcript_91036/g.161255  ORF Transcript_91036/g.161255 Transcript_91036/m.161255 type:complete len:105 (-) Transcript_91036:133-447(-)
MKPSLPRRQQRILPPIAIRCGNGPLDLQVWIRHPESNHSCGKEASYLHDADYRCQIQTPIPSVKLDQDAFAVAVSLASSAGIFLQNVDPSFSFNSLTKPCVILP